MNDDFLVRELSNENIHPYADLLNHSKTPWTNFSQAESAESRSQHLLNSELYRIFAAEDKSGRLRMSISARRWTALPAYTIVDFKTRDPMNLVRFKAGFSKLIGAMVSAMEDEGRLEFWYLIEDKKTYRSRPQRAGRNIMQYLVPSLGNYAIFDEARFEPNELPKWPLHVSMMMNQTVTAPAVLRRGIHKKKLSLS